MGSLSHLQGIFPTQGSNPGLPHCRWILYQLSLKGSPSTGVGSLSLLQGIFPTQESNLDLLHCRQILYQLSYQGRLLLISGPHLRSWLPQQDYKNSVIPPLALTSPNIYHSMLSEFQPNWTLLAVSSWSPSFYTGSEMSPQLFRLPGDL